MAPRGARGGDPLGRGSKTISRRAREIGIEHVYEDATDKLQVFQRILKRLGRTADRVCYVGDDLVDLPVMARVGFAVATAGAVDEVRRIAHYVTRRPGGRGAVRETVELILKYQDLWKVVCRRYQERMPDDLPAARRPWKENR